MCYSIPTNSINFVGVAVENHYFIKLKVLLDSIRAFDIDILLQVIAWCTKSNFVKTTTTSVSEIKERTLSLIFLHAKSSTVFFQQLVSFSTITDV